MKTIFICIDWFHPAYKAGGPVQSIANLVAQYHKPDTHFKIFCTNTDLDGSINKGVAFDEWVNYNDYTQVWYASKNSRSVKVIKKEINNTQADVLFIIGIYSWYFNLVPLLFGKARAKIVSVRECCIQGPCRKSHSRKKYTWQSGSLPACTGIIIFMQPIFRSRHSFNRYLGRP